MSQKAADQVTIVDVTDAYSVILTSEAFTFPGTTSAAKAGSTTTQVIAMRGASQVAAAVVLSEILAPSGVTVTKDESTTAPTLTIAVSSSVTVPGNVVIPVHVGDGITISKTFSFAIAFTGANGSAGKGISNTKVEYQASASGTTAPTGSWSTTIPSVSASQYLWARTTYTYTDSSTVTAYAVGMMGATGAKGADGSNGSDGKGVKSTAVTYQAGSSGTTVPTGAWGGTVPTVATGQYLWTRTITTYTDDSTSTGYSVGYRGTNGANGAAGADAITLVITSSNGFIFKNTTISTVLTAHVYQAGVELSGAALTSAGTIKWYKDGNATAVANGTTLTISAGDVSSKVSYTAQLEG